MTTPITRQSFLYNLFHSQSKDLSANEREKFKNIHIILACTTFGIGHAICGIAYLIQRSCSKASKVSQVAEQRFNPTSNTSTATVKQKPSEYPERMLLFKEKMLNCIETFENESSLDQLDHIAINRVIGGFRWPKESLRPSENNKEAILEILEDTSKTLIEGPGCSIALSMVSKEKDGFSTNVSIRLIFDNEELIAQSGPGVSKINNNVSLPNNLSF